jgi:hypothetical protein
MRTICTRLGAGSERNERPDETGAGATRCCTPAANGREGAAAPPPPPPPPPPEEEACHDEAVGISVGRRCRRWRRAVLEEEETNSRRRAFSRGAVPRKIELYGPVGERCGVHDISFLHTIALTAPAA